MFALIVSTLQGLTKAETIQVKGNEQHLCMLHIKQILNETCCRALDLPCVFSIFSMWVWLADENPVL